MAISLEIMPKSEANISSLAARQRDYGWTPGRTMTARRCTIPRRGAFTGLKGYVVPLHRRPGNFKALILKALFRDRLEHRVKTMFSVDGLIDERFQDHPPNGAKTPNPNTVYLTIWICSTKLIAGGGRSALRLTG
jgi:hypothetical protein